MIEKQDYKKSLEIIHFTEQVSTKLQGYNEKEIFSIIKEEFLKSGKYNITILKLSEDQSFLNIAETTFVRPEKKMTSLERIAGMKLYDYKINLNESSFYSRVILKNKAYCFIGEEIFKDLFPAEVAKSLTEATGYKYHKTIIAPLIINNNTAGAIAVSSPDFSEYLIPTIVHFSRHISNAIALSRSEQKYRDLVENINEIVISTDAQGIIQYINPQISLLGYSPEDYMQKPAIDFVYPDDRERVAGDLQKTMTTGEEFPTEFRMQAKNGKVFWFEDFGKVQYDDAGNIIGLTGILRNITEKKKNEKAIKRLNMAIEQSNDCIAIHRFDGIIYYANNSFLETFKYTRDDLINKRIKVYNSEQNYKLYLEWLENIKKTGSWSGETKPVRKDGTIFHSFMSAKVIYDEKGEPLEILAILKDITEFNKQKADLEKKNIALKEILSQIELEKKNIKDEITQKIDKIILPAMNHLINHDCITSELKNYIERIKTDFRKVTSSLISKSIDAFTKLSPKEFEICNMAKNGMKNREIAAILKITLQTVEKHKKNIRKKLGISGQKINLRTFLERM